MISTKNCDNIGSIDVFKLLQLMENFVLNFQALYYVKIKN